jgi:hypothetical protein
MSHPSIRIGWLFALIWMTALSGTLAYGQGNTPLTGTVVDSSGAVIPGADILAKNKAIGAETRAVTDEKGRFTIPALEPGDYTVTVSLMGFKTAVLPDIRHIVGTPTNISAKLELGKLEETVLVTGASEIVQTQTAAVTTTMSTKQITYLPLATRNTMDFLAMLPGVDASGAVRNSTVMGLRASATNVTIDGVNVQDNYLKSSDGFFARINPRLDAVEEVTVSTANPGAEAAGQGAVQVRFVTRSGTNQLQASAYWYARRPQWNSNYYFNKVNGLPNDKVKVDTFGFRVGGPVVIPKLFDGHDKAFFFFNYEEFRQPGEISRNRTIMSENARQGLFQYNSSAGVQTVNLYALAAANGQLATPDSVIGKLLSDIRSATATTGTITQLTDPNLQRYSFINGSAGNRKYPTTRVDVNVTRSNRVGVSYYYQKYASMPDTLNSVDPAFPGFPNTGGQVSGRWSVMGNWRSMLKSNLVSEFRMGATGGPVRFSDVVSTNQFSGTPVADQAGWGINLSSFGTTALSNAYVSRNPNTRDAPTYSVEDNLNWVRGNHTWSFGGTWTQVNMSLDSGNLMPSLGFGVDATDPANAMFSTTNFPGIAAADLTQARNLYAVLTGRVTSINANGVLDGATGKYVYSGRATQLGHMRELGTYVADSWRMRQGLTDNAGVRWEIQFPFVPGNNYYSQPQGDSWWGVSGVNNLFKPGLLAGTKTTFVQYAKGSKAFSTDYNNVAPSAGFAWTPSPKGGFLGALMGKDGNFVVRGGYSLSYNREGMGTYVNIFSANPGGSIDATRSMSLGNLATPTSPLPLLLRSGNLGPPVFPEAPVYPLTGVVTSAVNQFAPDTQVPYTHSWQLGAQRALTRNMAIEIRYVGTRGRAGWVDGGRNYNEVNVIENGFLKEFQLAQANLRANIAAGRGNTFKYSGPGTGTSPLPIFLAYFNGVPAAQAGDASLYTSANFGSSTYYNSLAIQNPALYTIAGTGSSGLQGSATLRANATAAGLPANFFVMNPDTLGGAWLTGAKTDWLNSNYDALQVELRRRLSKGLLVQASYTLGYARLSSFYTLRESSEMIDSTTNNTRHGFKINWVYELPFGRGRKWGSGVGGAVDRIIGGWEFDGGGRIQSGPLFDLGNVNVVGMSREDVQKMFKIYETTDSTGKLRYYMLPQDVVDNSIKAFNASATSADGYSSLGAPSGRYLAPASGPGCVQAIAGDCAPRHLFVRGPMFFRFDMSIVKRIPVVGRQNIEFRAEALNVFDNINFTPGTSSGAYVGATTANYEVTSSFRDTNNSQDPGGRLLQLSIRYTW